MHGFYNFSVVSLGRKSLSKSRKTGENNVFISNSKFFGERGAHACWFGHTTVSCSCAAPAAVRLCAFCLCFHQFVEGLVWLGLDGAIPITIQHTAEYLFAFIAYTFWPIYIPLAMYCFERSSIRRLMLAALVLGIVVGLYFLWSFTIYSPLLVEIDCSGEVCAGLAYNHQKPYLENSIIYYYSLAVVTPLLITRNKRIKFLITPVYLLSYPVAEHLSVFDTFASVWCFIAAMSSVSILFAFESNRMPSRSYERSAA